jgi:hypothetical protein
MTKNQTKSKIRKNLLNFKEINYFKFYFLENILCVNIRAIFDKTSIFSKTILLFHILAYIIDMASNYMTFHIELLKKWRKFILHRVILSNYTTQLYKHGLESLDLVRSN